MEATAGLLIVNTWQVDTECCAVLFQLEALALRGVVCWGPEEPQQGSFLKPFDYMTYALNPKP